LPEHIRTQLLEVTKSEYKQFVQKAEVINEVIGSQKLPFVQALMHDPEMLEKIRTSNIEDLSKFSEGEDKAKLEAGLKEYLDIKPEKMQQLHKDTMEFYYK
jgi:hypothetical protein